MRRVVSIRLHEAMLAAARRRATRHNRTLTNYIESILQRDLTADAADVDAKAQKKPMVSRVLRSVADLQAAINRFLAETNCDPKPFICTADPEFHCRFRRAVWPKRGSSGERRYAQVLRPYNFLAGSGRGRARE